MGPSAITTRGVTWNVLATHKEPGQVRVWIGKAGKRLAVSYGAEFHTFALSDYFSAFREYAMCVRHAIECNGKLDD